MQCMNENSGFLRKETFLVFEGEDRLEGKIRALLM